MSSGNVIECAGLTKRFRDVLAVDRLDLTVGRGEVYGFLGPNGAGKSTTIRMLLDLVRPTAGEARLFGTSVARDRYATLPRVGALVESAAFYDHLSGRQNLDMLAALSGGCPASRVDEVLAMVGLAERQMHKVGTYSHGMRQRLGLGQALLPRPELLILDEPATGLDPAGIVDIRNLLKHLAQTEGMTIFLSSHILSEVEATCSHIGLLSRGQLRAQGRVTELLAAGGEIVRVDVDDSARAQAILEPLEFVHSAAVADGTLDVRVEPGRQADVNAALVHAGLRVSALIPRRESLEELYMTTMAEAEAAHADPDTN